MQQRTIPVSQIDFLTPRLGRRHVQTLRLAREAGKTLPPISVRDEGNGRFTCFDGAGRTWSLPPGVTNVEARVWPREELSDVEMFRRAATENLGRGSDLTEEECERWAFRLRDLGCPPAQIARDLGWPVTKIERLFLRADRVVEDPHTGRIMFRVQHGRVQGGPTKPSPEPPEIPPVRRSAVVGLLNACRKQVESGEMDLDNPDVVAAATKLVEVLLNALRAVGVHAGEDT